MKGPLRAIRRYGAHVALILLIVLLGIYWLREPSLDQAEELIKEGKYADARALLDRFQKSEHDLDQPDRGRMRWLLAELILHQNKRQSALTIQDVRDVLALLRQAREDYLKTSKKTVPDDIYKLWLEAVEAFPEVRGHREALEQLAELSRLKGTQPELLLARARIERNQPRSQPVKTLQLLDEYLALKNLTVDQRHIGLAEKARTYQLRAERRELDLTVARGRRRLKSFTQLFETARLAAADYESERQVRLKMLSLLKVKRARLFQYYELGRIAFRLSKVREKVLRYLKRIPVRRDGRLAAKLRKEIEKSLITAGERLRPYVNKVKNPPQLAKAYFMMGESARLLQRHDEALKLFRKLEELGETQELDAIYLSLLAKGRVGIESKKWSFFEQLTARLIDLAATSPDQQYELGVLFEFYRDRRLDKIAEERGAALVAARKELKGPDELDKIRVESAMKESALMKIWDAKAAEMYLGASRVKQPSKSAESAMRAISLFDRVGNTAAAIQACDRFLDAGVRDPRVSRVLLLKGQQMLKLGLGADAIAAFEENIERYPNTPYSYQSLLGIGDAHAVLGETDLALFAYERIRTKDTRFDPRTPIWRGALYREGVLQVFHGLADPAGKKAALRQGISLLAGYSERYPTQALVRRADFYRALGLMGLGEWTRANEVFARLAETRVELEDPDREERLRIYMLSNYLHGIAYLQVMRRATPPAGPREWDTAIDILETAIERFGETPQSVWASSQLVVLYHQAGKDPQATKVGRKALWLANRVGTKPGFDSAFWTRWVQWKMAVLLPGANKQ